MPPIDIQALMAQATALQQKGDFSGAVALFKGALQQLPHHPQLLFFAGSAELTAGRPAAAIPLLEEAAKRAPGQPAVLANLGSALMLLGQIDAALRHAETAISVAPGYARAHAVRARALSALGRQNEALISFDKAIACDPNYGEAYYGRGNVHSAQGRLTEALADYDRALARRPNDAEALTNRGAVHLLLEHTEQALSDCEQAVRLAPNNPVAHNNLGNVLITLNRPEDALKSFTRAIALKPDYARAYSNRSGVLRTLERHNEALSDCAKAIAQNPKSAAAFGNRACILRDLKRFDEAATDFERALALNPGFSRAAVNYGYLKLLTGHFADGFRLYERRWECPEFLRIDRKFTKPRWRGEDIAGKTVLLYTEQGLGDFVQFIRYAPMIAARGGRAVIEVPAPLMALVRTLSPDCPCVRLGDPLPEHDLVCPVMSLPFAFATTGETIPAHTPYLSTDETKRAAWRETLGPKTMPRIGIAWAGNPENANDYIRSIPVRRLQALLRLPYEFHSLQKDIRPDDAAALAEMPHIRTHADEFGDFADTAALIAELDLVISVDSSVAHVAGAIGAPVWVFVPHVPDWRWLMGCDDNPWYANMRVFRQPAWGDWDRAIAAVAAALQNAFPRS